MNKTPNRRTTQPLKYRQNKMSAFVSTFPISNMPIIGQDCLTYEEYAIQSQEFALILAQEIHEFPISNMPTVGADCLTYEEYAMQSQEFALMMAQDFMELSNICDELTVAPQWLLNMEEGEEPSDEIVNICDELTVAPQWLLNMEEGEEPSDEAYYKRSNERVLQNRLS